jgi:DICT domain-containing protein
MDASVWNTDEHGRPCSCAVAGGLSENHFYLFDAEAILAASHAIEELALEEANGTLLATMQGFKHFEPHRERYWQLAATLADVRVIAHGKQPPRHGHLKFTATNHKALGPFWIVLYQGHRRRAMLVCRQIHTAKTFEERRFEGCYTFNRELIARVRQDLEQILSGRALRMREFERLLAIDQAAKKLAAEFTREHNAVDSALRKLQTAGDHDPTRHFEAVVQKSLSRLKRLTDRLPDLVGAARARLAA